MNYMHGLIMMMDPADFTNSSDTRLAVSRIITWTTEPKSVDVRKVTRVTEPLGLGNNELNFQKIYIANRHAQIKWQKTSNKFSLLTFLHSDNKFHSCLFPIILIECFIEK